MMFLPAHTKVFLALGHTDMRKSIDSLCVLAEYTLGLSPLSGHLFVFCNRRRTLIKILYWDRNGFCLFQKRLEKHRFKWPEKLEQVKQIDARTLSFLLEGLDITRIQPHKSLSYTTLI
jgi:transposase